MFQLAGTVFFGFVAAAFIWTGDPIMAFVFTICAMSWGATTSELRPLRHSNTGVDTNALRWL